MIIAFLSGLAGLGIGYVIGQLVELGQPYDREPDPPIRLDYCDTCGVLERLQQGLCYRCRRDADYRSYRRPFWKEDESRRKENWN